MKNSSANTKPTVAKPTTKDCGRSCYNPDVTDTGPGEVVQVRSGDGGMAGKGGRGKGDSSKSNYGPSANTY